MHVQQMFSSNVWLPILSLYVFMPRTKSRVWPMLGTCPISELQPLVHFYILLLIFISKFLFVEVQNIYFPLWLICLGAIRNTHLILRVQDFHSTHHFLAVTVERKHGQCMSRVSRCCRVCRGEASIILHNFELAWIYDKF